MNLLEGGWPFLFRELTGLALSLAVVPLVLVGFMIVLALTVALPRLGLEWALDFIANRLKTKRRYSASLPS